MYGKFYKRRNVKRRRPSRSYARKPTIKKAVKAATTRTFNRKVQRVLNRNIESKSVNFSTLNKPLYNVASVDWASSVLNILPQEAGSTLTCYTVDQGTAEGSRIGNDIRPSKCVLTGVIRCASGFDSTTNYNPCPLRVTLWLVKLQNHLTDSLTQLEQVVDNTFFKAGSASSGFSGTTIDLTRTYNNDQIKVLMKKSFYVGMGTYISGFAVNSANNAQQQFNQDGATMSRMFRVDCTKFIPKLMKFNDGTNTPTNSRKIYLMVTCQRADGNISQTSAGSATGPIPAYIDMGLDFQYKDA